MQTKLMMSAMIITRRDAVGLFALFTNFVASGRLGEAQTQTAPAPTPAVFKHDLPNVTMDEWEVTVNYVDYAPGRVGVPHHHAGFVLAYVLEGAVIAKISGQGEEKTYATGRCFTNSRARHTRSRKMRVRRSQRSFSR